MKADKLRFVIALAGVVVGLAAAQALAQKEEARAPEVIVLSGKEDRAPPFGAVTFRVTRSEVCLVNADGTTKGSWEETGNLIRFRFRNGKLVYHGTGAGKVLSGMASDGVRT